MRERHGPSHPTSHPAAADAGAVGKSTLSPNATDSLIADVKREAEHGHARRALHLLEQANPAEQATVADALGPQARLAFAKHMPHDVGDAAPSRHAIQVLFDHTPDSERATLELLLEARFKL